MSKNYSNENNAKNKANNSAKEMNCHQDSQKNSSSKNASKNKNNSSASDEYMTDRY